MADPVTSNIALAIPIRGTDVGTWDTPINSDFSSLDGFFGGVQTISASSSPITLTAPSGSITPSGGPSQSQNAVLRFTGVLTGAVQVTLPLPGFMIIENLTTGAFVLSFRAIGSGQVIAIQQGSCRHIYNDGTNVKFVNLPDVGTYLDVAATTVPSWIAACTVPPFLNCDGSTFNATTYPFLNSFLGGNTLPDLRGATRYTLNQGTSRLTVGLGGLDGNTLFATRFSQTNTILTGNLPPYTPSGNIAVSFPNLINLSLVQGGTGGTVNTGGTGSGATLIPVSATAAFTGSAQGGTSNPFSVIGTGTVAGITLIRAA